MYKDHKKYLEEKHDGKGLALGILNRRSSPGLTKRTLDSRYWDTITQVNNVMKEHFPEFRYSAFQINWSSELLPHVDLGNIGPSMIFSPQAVGSYTGGRLAWLDLDTDELRMVDLQGPTFVKFNGQHPHCV